MEDIKTLQDGLEKYPIDSTSVMDTDRNAILRVKDVDDSNSISGAIRYNEQLQKFQGCKGLRDDDNTPTG